MKLLATLIAWFKGSALYVGLTYQQTPEDNRLAKATTPDQLIAAAVEILEKMK